jgi:ATP-dependent helicase/nuclease subunit B
MAPSAFWNHLGVIFPAAATFTLPREPQQRRQHIGTPRQLVTSLLRWARSDETEADSVSPALYESFARHRCGYDCPDPIDTMRYRAWRALGYENDARLSDDVAARLFGSPLSASVSRIESFANCPFKHFARYGLQLEPRDEEDVTSMDLGNAYHSILETLVREIVKRREDFATVSPQFAEQQIKLAAQQIGESLRNEVLLSSARNQYLLKHVERTVDQVVAAQREIARRGKFRPWKAELSFGFADDESLPPLELRTRSAKTLRLRGRIDRVDLIDEEAAFAVIDYKLSGRNLKFESIYHGLSLQLITYLLVLQSEPAREKLQQQRLTPAAAFYVKLARRLEGVDHPDEATSPDLPAFHLKEKPRGVFDRRYLNALDRDLRTGASDVVAATIKKDGALGSKSDAVESESFAAILKFVEGRIVELAEEIFAGDIRVAPYRIGTTTPCPNCDYRSVCRFDPNRQAYRRLESKTKQQVIELAIGGKRDAR